MKKIFYKYIILITLLIWVNNAVADTPPFQTGFCFYPTNCFPPLTSSYTSGPAVQSYLYPGIPNIFVIDNLTLSAFTQCIPPPPTIGSQTIHTFGANFSGTLNTPFPPNIIPINGTAYVTIKMTKAAPSGSTENYDTELLQLDLFSGAILFEGSYLVNINIRESPTLQSLGQTTITPNGIGYTIESFFDIWTEISFDGGQNWAPSQQSGHIALPSCPPGPSTATIPTLSEWGLIILGFVLICLGIFYIRKRRLIIG